MGMSGGVRSSGLFLMVLAAFFFSLMTVFVKLVGDELPTAEVVLFRSIVAAVITIVMLYRRRESIFGNRKFLLFMRGATGTVGLLCFFYAIPRLELAQVTVIHYMNPIFVAMIAAVVLKEKFGWLEAISIGLGFSGVLLIARISVAGTFAVDNSELFAIGVALTGAFFAAIAYVIVRKLTATEHPLTIVLSFPAVAIVATIPMLVDSFVWPTPVDWLYLLLVGVTGQVAQIFMTLSYKAETAARASSVSYIQMFWAVLWGIILFREFPDLWLISGSVLIIAGILILSFFHRRWNPPQPANDTTAQAQPQERV